MSKPVPKVTVSPANDIPEFKVFNRKEPYNVTKEEELWICQAYSMLTSLKSDVSTKRDCKKAFSALGFDVNNDGVKTVMEKFNSGEGLDFNGFLYLMKSKLVG